MGTRFLVGGGNELKVFDALNGEIVDRVLGNRGGNSWYDLVAGTSLVAAAGADDTLLIDLSPGGIAGN